MLLFVLLVVHKNFICQQVLTLFVAVPPTKAELVGHAPGAQLSVKEEEEVELKCVIHNARPRPDIIWYLGDREFVSGMATISLSRDLL